MKMKHTSLNLLLQWAIICQPIASQYYQNRPQQGHYNPPDDYEDIMDRSSSSSRNQPNPSGQTFGSSNNYFFNNQYNQPYGQPGYGTGYWNQPQNPNVPANNYQTGTNFQAQNQYNPYQTNRWGSSSGWGYNPTSVNAVPGNSMLNPAGPSAGTWGAASDVGARPVGGAVGSSNFFSNYNAGNSVSSNSIGNSMVSDYNDPEIDGGGKSDAFGAAAPLPPTTIKPAVNVGYQRHCGVRNPDEEIIKRYAGGIGTVSTTTTHRSFLSSMLRLPTTSHPRKPLQTTKRPRLRRSAETEAPNIDQISGINGTAGLNETAEAANFPVPVAAYRLEEIDDNSGIEEDRIVGGDVANVNYYPWQISLRYNDIHVCGGSIIDERYVVTAAHCFEKRSPDFTDAWTVYAGKSKVSTGENHEVGPIAVKRIKVHENYNDLKQFDSDIALIELEEPLPFSNRVYPICLPRQGEQIVPGRLCFVSGYGKTQRTGGRGQLKATHLPVLENSECGTAAQYDHLTPNMLCAGLIEGGRGSCQGDSGGPLACMQDEDGSSIFKLHGIVSFGYECASKNSPSVYVRVANYVNWIHAAMGKVIEESRIFPPGGNSMMPENLLLNEAEWRAAVVNSSQNSTSTQKLPILP